MIGKFIPRTKKGMAPGTLIYEGDTEPKSTQIVCYSMSNSGFESFSISSAADLPEHSEHNVFWLRIIGLADISLISDIGKNYGIGQLTLEDVLETSHRPKFEDNLDYLFVIMKQLTYNEEVSVSTVGQVSFIIGQRFILTFEEWETSELNLIATRVIHKPRVFFAKGPEYLVYSMIDSVVDNYLSELNVIEADIEDIEDQIMDTQLPIDTDDLFELKRRINMLHRTTRSTYEIVDKLGKAGRSSINDNVSTAFYKDLADHAIRLNDNIQNGKDAINAIYDENNSRMQLSTSSSISVLTVFSVIFLPPMVISGIYGMNFSNMPLLESEYGYWLSIIAMLTSSLGLLFFFKKKKYF